MGLVQKFDDRFYPHQKGGWDHDDFRNYILKHIQPHFTMLDMGAGAGILPQMNFRGAVAKVCGLDPNPRIVDNPYLDEAQIGFGDKLPWADNSFDIAVSANVLEHLEAPAAVFKELSRVLKPGGIFLFKTPNRTHYMPLIAQMTPFWFHQYYNRIRGRADEDTFPTLYRANTPKDIARETAGLPLQPEEFILVEGRPEYLRISPVSYLGGIAYERLVNSTDALRNFRIVLMGKLRKAA